MQARPPISADGRWWWDGFRWQPISTYPGRPGESSGGFVPPVSAGPDSSVPPVAHMPSWLPPESQYALLQPRTPLPPLAVDRVPVQAQAQPAWEPMAGGDGTVRWTAGALVAVLLLTTLVVGIFAARGSFQGGFGSPGTQSATQQLAAAQRLMIGAEAYHLAITGPGESTDITVGDGRASMDTKSVAGEVTQMVVDGRSYLKAPASFYADKNPALAQSAADQWLMLIPTESLPALDELQNLNKVSHCLLGAHGSLKLVGGKSLSGGLKVIEVDDQGNAPGATSARFYVSTDDQTLVGMDVTGPTTAGGTDAAGCQLAFGLASSGFHGVRSLRFDSWNIPVHVSAPDQAIDLTTPAWCGTIVGSQLSDATRQFLLAVYELDRKLGAVSDETVCACRTGSWPLYAKAMTDEADARQAFAQAIAGLPLQGQDKSDADAAAQATRATVDTLRQGAASGSYAAYQLRFGEQRDSDETTEQAAFVKLRGDLGLPGNACTFTVP